MQTPSKRVENVDYLNRQGDPVEPDENAVFKYRSGAFVLCMAEDRLLMIKPKDGQGLWEIPGGGIDQGETPEQTILRETIEETGLDISNGKLKQIHTQAVYQHIAEQDCFWNYDQLYFKLTEMDLSSRVFDGHLTSPEEGKLAWITMDELQNLPMKNTVLKALTELGFVKEPAAAPRQKSGQKPRPF